MGVLATSAYTTGLTLAIFSYFIFRPDKDVGLSLDKEDGEPEEGG
jgi:hypothetical protein